MTVATRIREHLALTTKGILVVGGLGGATGVIGLVQLVSGADGISAWGWVCTGMALIAASQAWSVQRALDDRRAALVSRVTQTLVHVGPGASLSNASIERTRMTVGGPATPARPPRYRRVPRLLDESMRDDLVKRLEQQGVALAEWVERAEPAVPADVPLADRWDAEARLREAFRKETEVGVRARFLPRARDLLNETAEAGYSLPPSLMAVREEGADWHEWDELAQGLVILALRVSRRSKRL